ncbi:hypothetical protein THAOC_01328 [Thalassiosira oceanica]|uniref:Uncharacterized protein n=1 Tax=Thalassiosira oceanica TaxID=159749 RepID=K0TIL1_THAOC|nr:hypothetical protein THAOC_01328 [Thalassiosira oceanica]|eukprot:EJK76884.1 hypothetical protein THAOC_01328 [Thalassiosira oceanica]
MAMIMIYADTSHSVLVGLRMTQAQWSGKLLLEGAVLHGCHGNKKYNAIFNGTFREGLLTHGEQVMACGVRLYEGDFKCVEADGRVTFFWHGSGAMAQNPGFEHTTKTLAYGPNSDDGMSLVKSIA